MTSLRSLFFLSLIVPVATLTGCRTSASESDPQDVEISVLPDGSMVVETAWYNAFPTQQSQAIAAALEAAGDKLEEILPGMSLRQQLLESAGEIDFSTAVRFGQAILDSEINLPSQFEGLKFSDMRPKGFVIMVGGGVLDHIEIREGIDISATLMFTFIPRLYYRKVPGEDELRAYYTCKVGLSVLTVKPIGLQKVTQVARIIMTRGVSLESSVVRPDQLTRPIKVGIGLVFGDVTAPNQLYSSVAGGRFEFQTSYFTGPLAHLNGSYRAQAIAVNEEILSVSPKALILSLERHFTTGAPQITPPQLLLGGNVSLGFIVDRLQRFFSADLLRDENGEASVMASRDFPIQPPQPESGSDEGSGGQGYEDEF